MSTANACRTLACRFPAEWEPHRATWISWPHEPSDWPGKFPTVDWVYSEIVRHLATSERVEILCHNQQTLARAKECLEKVAASDNYQLHLRPTDRSWLRDSAPTLVYRGDEREWVAWKFNAWAKYENYHLDSEVPSTISSITKIPYVNARRPDTNAGFVLEGGAIDCDGLGTLLTTEECLLSSIQERNPGLTREAYENLFAEYLGISKTIWLAGSCEGDDTHGHIDDVARFVAPGKIVLAFEDDPRDPNHEVSLENFRRLKVARDSRGKPLEIIKFPMPHPLHYDGYRLPASYANFYIGNKVILCPTFNDPRDREVISSLASLFPDRSVVGIHCVDLVLGFGTLHCLTQQEPEAVAL